MGTVSVCVDAGFRLRSSFGIGGGLSIGWLATTFPLRVIALLLRFLEDVLMLRSR